MLVHVKKMCTALRTSGGCTACGYRPAASGCQYISMVSGCLWRGGPEAWDLKSLQRADRTYGALGGPEGWEAVCREVQRCVIYKAAGCVRCPHWDPVYRKCVVDAPPFTWYTRKTRAVWRHEAYARRG